MEIRVTYYSYFKDFAGCSQEVYSVPVDCTLEQLYGRVSERHPRFAEARKSCLMAVGVEYQRPDHRLSEGEEVSLFPPVQGG